MASRNLVTAAKIGREQREYQLRTRHRMFSTWQKHRASVVSPEGGEGSPAVVGGVSVMSRSRPPTAVRTSPLLPPPAPAHTIPDVHHPPPPPPPPPPLPRTDPAGDRPIDTDSDTASCPQETEGFPTKEDSKEAQVVVPPSRPPHLRPRTPSVRKSVGPPEVALPLPEVVPSQSGRRTMTLRGRLSSQARRLTSRASSVTSTKRQQHPVHHTDHPVNHTDHHSDHHSDHADHHPDHPDRHPDHHTDHHPDRHPDHHTDHPDHLTVDLTGRAGQSSSTVKVGRRSTSVNQGRLSEEQHGGLNMELDLDETETFIGEQINYGSSHGDSTSEMSIPLGQETPDNDSTQSLTPSSRVSSHAVSVTSSAEDTRRDPAETVDHLPLSQQWPPKSRKRLPPLSTSVKPP